MHDQEDDDEQTPDFEDLLAAYDLSDTAAVTSTASSNATSTAAGDQVNVGASGSGSSTSIIRAGVSGGGIAIGTSSLSILKEMARMEPPIRDANISIRTASSEIVVKENGVVDFRKPFCPPKSVSGGKPANMQRIILDLAQQKDVKARAKPSARKTTSCKTLLTSNGPRPLLLTTTATKAKKSVMHLGPIRTPAAFSGLQPRVTPASTKFTPPPVTPLHIPQSVCTSNVAAAFDEEEEEAAAEAALQNGSHDENGFSDAAGDVLMSASPALEDDPIEEASHQLYTCVLPPYVPKASQPAFDNSSDDHHRGYPCLDCADRFLVEPSLAAHLERRSVHITLNCSACKQEIIFHNRCTLLGHVRTHRERNQPSDLSNILVRPLEPSEFIERSATSFETNDPDNENDYDDDDVNNLSIGINSSSSSSNMKTSKYQCHECQQYCGSSLSLQEHFGYSRSRAVNTVKCVRCDSVCPSKCSLSAHLRLHDRRRPFLCPECGLIVADSWDVFQRHLSTVCLHLSRTTGYKCPTPACDALYSTPSDLGDHVVDSHGDSLHKCQGCPMAFRSRESFEIHRLEKHGGGGPDSAVQCRTVSKCPLCDVVFQNTEAFRTHLSTHADSLEQDLRFLYRCSVCKLFLEDKSMLSRHLKRNHPSVFKMRCKICRSAFRDLDLLIDHMRRKHPEQTEALKEIEAQTETKLEVPEAADQQNNSHADDASDQSSEMLVTLDFEDGVHQSSSSSSNNNNNNNKKVECRQCRRSFHSTLGLKMHLLRSHSADDKRSWCAVCSEYLPDPKEMAQHGHTVHLDAGQLVCTLCSNTVFGTKFGLAKHLDQHAEGPIGYPLECVHCDLNLEDAKAAANHWKSEHRLFSFTCDQCDAQYLQENSFLRHKRCAHGEGDANKKYYRCSMCEDVDFAKRSNLVHHLETKHGIPRTDIDLTQLVSTQCSPAAKFQASSSSPLLTSTPIATPTPPSPLPLLAPSPQPQPEPEPIQPQSTSSSPSKRKKKRKRKKETKRDRKKRRSRSSTSRSSKKPSSSSSESKSATALTLATTEGCDKMKEPLDEEKENNEDEEQEQQAVEAVEEKSSELLPPPEKKLKLDVQDQEPIERHVCAKCKYEASKRSEFIDHIRQHKKAGDNNYQCLECGLCFVVEPSLRKHLTYVHKVRDVDKFMTDKSYPTYVMSTCNGTILLESLSSTPTTDQDHQHHHHHPSSSSAAGSDQQQLHQQQRIFQCDVCRNTFDTELALRTHMRTHGMAFLKIKRISNVTVNEVSRSAVISSSSSPHKK